ncbi:hypothetical protein KY290_032754 [Solanum tuberosum]|uniref:Disease resistance protein At4g27190-like leucine-rich repeats domain-containing protein n=1 Tax=Solanum tuberosum TaxID=4113 RepID=A0ABQ7UCY9_SOLTU|nr:hypothetical protein KY285_030820 [Solanum tuberosum]KAH0744761.1 hypothetical protein KY290_032754 [Solanum tuberosum]
MLELRNEYKRLERISAGVLSRLVQLEELYMVGVEYCSYSTLRELESLPRLTSLTLRRCSGDVIYSHLSLSSKLVRYALTVGGAVIMASSMDDYDKVISLEVTETAQLDDWICHLLKESEYVDSTRDGSNNVLTKLQLNEFQNIKCLRLSYCKLVTHLLNISRRMHEVIKFPNLYDLKLESLKCLTHFCNTTVEGIEFPRLRKMLFHYLPELQNFWPTANNSITHSSPLFDEKVCCPRLEELNINGANSISALCSHQLPAAYFSKRETLYVANCGKLRNLMPPSVARGLLNLRKLEIRDCLSMEEVITKEKQQGEGIMTLFPLLEKLELYTVPKLGHFFLTECTLEIPFLKEVHISDCPEMKTFVQQGISVSTPSLESVNNDDEVKVVDLNKVMFNSKVSCPNLEKLYINGANSISALWSHQLPTAYFSKLKTLEVEGCGKLRNLMSPSVARGARNLRILEIKGCQSMEEVITKEEQKGERIMTLFPLLEHLTLRKLPKLGHFFLTECTLEIPILRHLLIKYCPEMKTFVQQGISVSTPSLASVNNDDEVKVVDLNKAMFNSKVCCPSLEELLIWGTNSISALYSQQFPTAYFSKLERLEVKNCGKLRNLMSPSVARGALNLRILNIIDCESMKEVITEEEQGEEIMTNEPLFPLKCIFHCPEMKPFVQQGISVSTPSFESLNNDDEVKVDDLNKAMFNSKVSCPNLEYLYIYDANSISALCSHQLSTAYFSKLETLYILNCGKLRNLMSPSVARGARNLRILDIKDCDSMEEVITKEEQKGEGIMTLFPLLKHLTLQRLPKLGHFFLTECTLEIPILSTPSLEIVNNDDEVKVDDLNKWTQQRFNSKEQSTGDGNEVGPSYDKLVMSMNPKLARKVKSI